VAKPETSFRTGIEKYLPQGIHHEKMNNPYSSGTADSWYSGNRGDLWVEYKFLPQTPLRAIVHLTPDKTRTSKHLSVLQEKWLRGRYEEGRTVAVVVGCPDGGIILRDQEWEWEYTPQMFRDRLLPRKSIAQWIAQTTQR
jgi:hypothetical protein